MAINADVMEIVRILDEEDFGWLAGELLTEISLGRESDEKRDRKSPGEQEDEELDSVSRDPIPDEEQFAEAIGMLRLRLVAPIRALAQAESIAGSFDDRDAVRVQFVDFDGGVDERMVPLMPPGDTGVADKLDDVLGRILEAPRNLEV